MANEILSKGLTLSYATNGTTYTALTNLIDIPNLGGTAEKVDVTNLADGSRRSIKGIIDYGDLEFNFYYDKTQFAALSALSGVINWKVSIPDGASGAAGTVATFSGEPTVALSGAGVNEAVKYTLTIALNSEIVFA